MDLLVKGMEMPKSCGKCPMMRPGNYKGQAFPCTCHAKDCFPIKPSELDLRDGLCPLVKVPTPHGRLIDADALLESIKEARKKDPEIEDVYIDDYFTVAEWVVSAPTIVEKEDKE